MSVRYRRSACILRPAKTIGDGITGARMRAMTTTAVYRPNAKSYANDVPVIHGARRHADGMSRAYHGGGRAANDGREVARRGEPIRERS